MSDNKNISTYQRGGFKLTLISALSLSIIVALGSTALAKPKAGKPSDYPVGTVGNGIINTRHNLSANSLFFQADNVDGNGGTTEICVFCHTPHHSEQTVDLPLWNRGINTNYTMYGTTIGGTVINDPLDCTVSLACLSCHDGVSSFDTLVNAPGYGNGGVNNTTATDHNWTFTEAGGSNPEEEFMVRARVNIGTDLTNDHPVCMPYYEDRASLRPTSTVISSVLMTSKELSSSNASDASSKTATSNRWVISGIVSGDATIGDLLRGDSKNRLECSSCHDPHFNNKSWDEVFNTWKGDTSGSMYLRRIGGNSISGVCRTCHNK